MILEALRSPIIPLVIVPFGAIKRANSGPIIKNQT